jgi:hypothetical protein
MKSILIVAALGLSSACASTMSSGAPARTAQAGPCSPALANPGTIVYSRPDSTSDTVATIAGRTQVCADSESVGFGFRHVKLESGRDGYVSETELSL